MSDLPSQKSWLERATTAVGIAGSLITVALTAWNAQTKQQIDQREADLKMQTAALDAELRRRSTSVEESKERVERYKWVYGLVPELSAADGSKRNAALAMVRLALSKEEAEGLLAGLQQSPDEQVRKAAAQGVVTIANIENAELVRLVSQVNAAGADERRRATGRLQRDFNDSAEAISLALKLLDASQVDKLSPSGLINVLYFLSRTDPRAWTPTEIAAANRVLPGVRARNAGPQTQAELGRVEDTVKAAGRQ